MSADKIAELLKMLQLDGDRLGTATRKNNEDVFQDMASKLERMKRDNAKKLFIRESMSLDLLFLLDVTVSMKPYRDAVVKEIGRILTYLEGMFKYSRNNIRVGVVGYRDLHLTPRFEVKPFTPITAGGEGSVKEWLEKLEFRTSTANDHPEDVHGGLEKAASEELGWQSPARTIIHIADAPGHGTRLAPPDAWWGTKGDFHPDYDTDGSVLTRLLKKLRVDLQVQTYKFIHVIDPARKVPDTLAMLEEFHRACGDPAWIAEAEWQGDEEMALEVVAAASESIKQSVSMRSGLQVAPPEREYKMDAAEPDWESIPALHARTSGHDTKSLRSIETLLDLIRGNKHIRIEMTDEEGSRACIRIAPNPFAKGKNRLAYYARFYPKGLNGGEVREVVVKEFLASDGRSNAAVAYKAQLETHSVASFLAGEFNRHMAAADVIAPRVVYAPCELLSVKPGPGGVRFYLMEPLILGTLYKWNNNFGAMELDDPQPHLQAFSHWTYEVSDRTLMVVDVQGFRTLDTKDDIDIVLIDPAIHCVKPDFYGVTNMAAVGGFEAFLHSHQNPQFASRGGCGSICKALVPGVEEFRRTVAGGAGGSSGSPARGLWRGGSTRAVSAAKVPRGGLSTVSSVNSTTSISTTDSVDHRMSAVKKALKAHDLCRRYLVRAGLAVPSNLHAAIELCAARGLLKPALAKEFHDWRKAANAAKHAWDE